MPKDNWSWNPELIPIMKEKLHQFIMEYVKYTQKIYILGGRGPYGSHNRVVSSDFFYEISIMHY